MTFGKSKSDPIWGNFSKTREISKGPLPPEDGPDRAENLTQSVSDDIAKNVFRASFWLGGATFRKKREISKGLPLASPCPIARGGVG